MEQREAYSVQELYEELPITLVELGNRAHLNEVTIARIRDGKPSRRSSVNSLLLVLSDIYKRPLSLKNVTGINVQRNLRLERKQARQQSSEEPEKAVA
jgi:predicted transcriptional regulator